VRVNTSTLAFESLTKVLGDYDHVVEEMDFIAKVADIRSESRLINEIVSEKLKVEAPVQILKARKTSVDNRRNGRNVQKGEVQVSPR